MKIRFLLTTLGVATLCTIVFVPLAAQNPTRTFTPVTDAMLRNPSPDDWLNWRRTLDGWGYSPLNQITRQNVGQLQLAWSWAMQPGSNQATPLVHDGVMYLPNPNSVVQALDAATGDLILSSQIARFRCGSPCGAWRSGTTRSTSTQPTRTSSRST